VHDLNQLRDLIAVSDVTWYGEDISVARQFVLRTDKFILVSRADRNFRALANEIAGEHQSQASGSARDQDYFIVKIHSTRCPNSPADSCQREQRGCDLDSLIAVEIH
jgi:hypothetical protein